MSVALLSIGTELTRGELHNKNAGWLAERLTSLGYQVTEMVSVDDDDARIISTLSALSERHEAILSTGGLGPTTDDRTTACVARLLAVELVRDESALSHIRTLFEKFGRTMSPSNEKQADFPRGATVLSNDKGTAPGFMVEIGPCRAFFMPGVPREMSDMFEREVVARLPKRQAPFVTVRLRTFGMPEAEVNDRLADIESKHGITIGYRASHSEIEVKILAAGRVGETAEQVEARATSVADEVADRLGTVVYGRGSPRLPEVVGRLLVEREATLSLGESCTGGLLSQFITQVPGASQYYRGGVVSYDNAIKVEVLGVAEALINEHGAVSEEVARAMAAGARTRLGSTYAIGITGVAGPGGGTLDKPVGLVHWAVSGPTKTTCMQRVFFGDRAQIQHRAAMNALFSLYRMLFDDTDPGR